MKNNRGEISILMIITIICLIVFGGICIFMLTGENGLFIEKGKEINNNLIENNVQENTNEINDKSNETANK